MRTLKGVLVLATACLLALPACGDDEETEPKKEICGNQIDDDGDSKTDCADSDCAAEAACQPKQEICDNQLDDDGDSQFDCDDPDCDTAANCQAKTENCNNGNVDDDGDGKADCEDSDCATAANCVGCATGETECGSDCCAAGETCVDNKSCVGTQPAGCAIAATYGEVTVTGEVGTDTGYMEIEGALPASDGTMDLVRLEMYEGSGAFTGGFQSGTFELAGADLNYKTCGLCLRIFADVTETALDSQFFAKSGSVNVTLTATTLTAVATGVTFEEVTIASDYTSTPVEGGCQSVIDQVTFDGTIPEAPTTCIPFASDCAEGQGCYFDTGIEDFTCQPAGTIAVGQACEAIGECVPGAECMSSGFCTELCGEASDCTDPAASCAPTSMEGIGICKVLEVCDDAGNVDEDGDGKANCADSDCGAFPACVALVCDNAIELTAGTPVEGSIDTGTQSAKGTCGGNGKEVVYTVTGGTEGQTGVLVINLQSAFDATLYARTTCTDTATQVACKDDAMSNGTETLVIENFVGGSEVTVFVDAYSSTGTGAFTLDVQFQVPVCGNGAVEFGETCDDSNTVADPVDGCDASCQVVTGWACPTAGSACREIKCADGFLDAGEICEPDPENAETDGCTADCKFAPAEIATLYTEPATGSLPAGGEKWYRVDVAQDSSLTAEITDGATTTCASQDLDTIIELYTLDNVLMGVADDGGVQYCSKMFVANLSAGSYLIKVYGYDEAETYDYTLTVTLGAVAACSAPTDYGDPASFTNGAAEEYLFWGIFPVALLSTFDLNGDPDVLSLNVIYQGQFEDGAVTGTFELTGDELDPSKCSLCLGITESNGRTYIPTGGSVTLTSVTGNLEGTLNNVTFTEAIGGIEAPNACPTKITSGSFSAPIAAPPAE